MDLKQIKKLPFAEFAEESQVRWKVTVREPVIEGERLLVVDFLKNTACTSYRRADESIRLICAKKSKWAKGITAAGTSWNKVLDQTYTIRFDYPSISEQDEKRIQRFLGCKETKNHQLDNLYEWVRQTREEMKRRERRKRGELMDEDYQLCPEALPEGLLTWIEYDILGEDNILVYKRGNVRGLCFQCGEKVRATTKKFTQHTFVNCPNCGSRVQCVLEDGSAYKAERVQNIIVPQRGTDGETIFFRQFTIMRDMTAQWNNLERFLKETARYAVRGDKTAKWVKEIKDRYTMYQTVRCDLSEWTRSSGNRSYDYSGEFFFYGINDVLAGTRMQYAPLQAYMQGGARWKDPRLFLTYFAKYPVIEFLWKAGYTELVRERIYGINKKDANAIHWQGKKLKDCFKFPMRFLKWKEPENWKMQQISRLNGIWERKRHVYTEAEIRALMVTGTDEMYIQTALEYSKLMPILKYLEKQMQTLEEGNDEVGRMYRDYLQECRQLSLDLSNKELLFPPDLEAAHNRTMAQISFEKNKAEQEKFRKAVEKLEKFAWQQGEFLIRPAREQKELSAEGAALHHCVGGYIQRMAEGQTAIFFLRNVNEPDKPYFTLELKGKEVIQCRTKHNSSYTNYPDVEAFVDLWMKKVVLKGGNKKKKTKEAAA